SGFLARISSTIRAVPTARFVTSFRDVENVGERAAPPPDDGPRSDSPGPINSAGGGGTNDDESQPGAIRSMGSNATGIPILRAVRKRAIVAFKGMNLALSARGQYELPKGSMCFSLLMRAALRKDRSTVLERSAA